MPRSPLTLFAALLLGCSSSTEPAPGTIALSLQQVASGLAFPLDLEAPPGDARLFVAEKGGRIQVLHTGLPGSAPFPDLSSLVWTGGEQGLLGLAFDPAYAATGRFIVNYTDVNGDTRIAAFHVSTDASSRSPRSSRSPCGGA